jgi:NADPH-dependent 2,4-dienoyl-CoA reductase/sulfur reductase-like enzyme/nitrite reductase/ring-hydroxylating ferredoxin subunit
VVWFVHARTRSFLLMAAQSSRPEATDFSGGVPAASMSNGDMRSGRIGDDEVLLVRADDRFFAIGAHCTHYKGSLVDGLAVDRTVRCPLHHACFSLDTGEALRAPALDPVARWRVEQVGERVFIREKVGGADVKLAASPQVPSSIGIIGGGAAAIAAADMLRRKGYGGAVTMVSADRDPPVDRPNLSKDYLAGEAQDDWIPLWPADLYEARKIELMLGSRVTSLDASRREITLENGTRREFGALLIATGAEPVRLPMPGATPQNVFYLRSFADSRAIVERTRSAHRVVVVGASFIGLEVAASLRTRGLAVDVVAPEAVPLERTMGSEIGRFVKGVHEAHGVTFHLGQTVVSVAGNAVTLSGGPTIEADGVVVGVGVRPATALAEHAGLAVDHGVMVNEYLETSASGIYAAGDIARWPDPHTGEKIRVEHWVVAERQGQVAARNMIGLREAFDAVPFFWSQHYDVTIRYIGHAEKWDAVKVDGSLDAQDASVSFIKGGRRLAVATVSRDRECLAAELNLERVMKT